MVSSAVSKKITTKKIAAVGLFAAIASLLTFFSFPLVIFPSFLKLDFSDLPAVLGALLYGPMVGLYIQLIRNIFSFIMGSQTAGIGEFANFVIGTSFVFPIGYLFQKKKNMKSIFPALFLGTITMTIVGCLMNYFVLLPAYEKAFSMPREVIIGMASKVNPWIDTYEKLIFASIAPFNLIKGTMITVLSGIVVVPALKVLKNAE